MADIKIVYYAYLNKEANWQTIISGQLTQLKGYGILDHADLYVHITDTQSLENDARALIAQIAPSAIVSANHVNQYEYPAIKLLHGLAKQYPSCKFIYFHTKGMSYNAEVRSAVEVALFTETFKNWRKAINLLGRKGISKVGLFPAIWMDKPAKRGEIGGWIFYNFWYATGEYLTRVETPQQHDNRYYYEGWLGRATGDEPLITYDCKSIFKIPLITKDYFTGDEADFYLKLCIDGNARGMQKYLKIRLFAYCYLTLKRFRKRDLKNR